MARLLFIVLTFASFKASAVDFVLEFGLGYKFNEPTTIDVSDWRYQVLYGTDSARTDFGSKVSGFFDIGLRWKLSKSWRVKTYISHHSQPTSGYPFNDDPEYFKTELAISVEYVTKLGD